jgi:hypothetical protein
MKTPRHVATLRKKTCGICIIENHLALVAPFSGLWGAVSELHEGRVTLCKLHTLESLYEKMSDQAANHRLEILEWIIILLIALSIVLPFIPGMSGH